MGSLDQAPLWPQYRPNLSRCKHLSPPILRPQTPRLRTLLSSSPRCLASSSGYIYSPLLSAGDGVERGDGVRHSIGSQHHSEVRTSRLSIPVRTQCKNGQALWRTTLKTKSRLSMHQLRSVKAPLGARRCPNGQPSLWLHFVEGRQARRWHLRISQILMERRSNLRTSITFWRASPRVLILRDEAPALSSHFSRPLTGIRTVLFLPPELLLFLLCSLARTLFFVHLSINLLGLVASCRTWCGHPVSVSSRAIVIFYGCNTGVVLAEFHRVSK